MGPSVVVAPLPRPWNAFLLVFANGVAHEINENSRCDEGPAGNEEKESIGHRHGQNGEVFSVLGPQSENFWWLDCGQVDQEQVWEGRIKGEVSCSKKTFRYRFRPLVCGCESCPQGPGLTGFCGNWGQIGTREGFVRKGKVTPLKTVVTFCLRLTPDRSSSWLFTSNMACLGKSSWHLCLEEPPGTFSHRPIASMY